jgi:large subunit ribosomal protein L29
MKAGEVHSMQDIELVEKLKEAREEAFNLRLRHATGELDSTAGLSRARKDVARLLTVARQRNIDLEREQGAK